MTNPVLVEVVRSGFVESVHRGALVILGRDGEARCSVGDVRSPVYPRSSTKPLQAIGMLRAGLRIEQEDLALACASHNGEPAHVRRALALLHAHGLTEDDLACPPDYSLHEPSKNEAIRAGAGKRRATMNCSGKHAAMLATCAQLGWPETSYTEPKHQLQQAITDAVTDLTGEPVPEPGVDGCGAPLFAYSPTGLARAFSRIATATDGPEMRVASAMRAHPWLVGGTGREDTLLMHAVDGLLAKAGAEGVHAIALPDGTAIAMKLDDGAARARGPVAAGVLDAVGARPSSPAARSVLDGIAKGTEGDSRGAVLGGGEPVGELRMADGVLDQLYRS